MEILNDGTIALELGRNNYYLLMELIREGSISTKNVDIVFSKKGSKYELICSKIQDAEILMERLVTHLEKNGKGGIS